MDLEKRLKIEVFINEVNCTELRTAVESDVMRTDELVRCGFGVIEGIVQEILPKLNRREKKAFINVVLEAFKEAEKEID